MEVTANYQDQPEAAGETLRAAWVALPSTWNQRCQQSNLLRYKKTLNLLQKNNNKCMNIYVIPCIHNACY